MRSAPLNVFLATNVVPSLRTGSENEVVTVCVPAYVGSLAVPPKRTFAMPLIVEEMAPLPTWVVTHLPVPVTRPPRLTLRVKVALPVVRVVCPYSLDVPPITPLPVRVPVGKPGLAAAWPAGPAAPPRGRA